MTSNDIAAKDLASPHASLKDRARREFTRFLFMFLYLWVMLFLFELHAYAVLAKHGIGVFEWGFSFVNALVLAKVMVVADNIKVATWLKTKPLIVPALLRSVFMAAFLVVFDIVEKIIVGAFRHQSVAESVPAYGGGGFLGSLLVGVILAFSLIPFFAFEEVGVAMGPGTLGTLLFGRRLGQAR
jgi:hypothetical protein